MKRCSLTRCNKLVGRGQRYYCSKEHARVGGLNNIVANNANRTGAKVSTCTTKGCYRLYQGVNEDNKCLDCRLKIDKPCGNEGCAKNIPAHRRSQATYCSYGCAQDAKNKKRKTKYKSKRIKINCATEGCDNQFYKMSGTHAHCDEHRIISGEDIRRDSVPSSYGKSWHDFRATICHRDKKLCCNFQECSDSLAYHKNGQFKYQTNGGVNCWEKPTRKRQNFLGSSFAEAKIL